MDDAGIFRFYIWKKTPPFLIFTPIPHAKRSPPPVNSMVGIFSFLIFQALCQITSFRPYRPAASEA